MKHLLGIAVFGLLFAIGTGAAVTTVRSSEPQPLPIPAGSIPDGIKNEETAPLFDRRLVDEENPHEKTR